MKKLSIDDLMWVVLIVILVLSALWNLQQGLRIDRLEERSDAYVIKMVKHDGVLELNCWCGNYMMAQDPYVKQFFYTCGNCGTIYTDTNCKTEAEFSDLMGFEYDL